MRHIRLRTTRPCIKQGTRSNLLESRLSLDKGVHLEQSPKDSTDCGQNSPATCRRSVQSTVVSMNSDVGTYCNPTSSHNTMQKGGCRQESAESLFLLVVGVAVQNRSCRLWGSMAGAVSAFVCHAILEGSIQQSLPHCAYSQLRRLLKWTQTQIQQQMRLSW